MEISRSYEILGDEQKKREFDQFGRVGDSNHYEQAGSGQFFRTPFGTFHFQSSDTAHSKYRVTQRILRNTVIASSYERPFLFFATTDYCFQCVRVQPIWDQFVIEAEAAGLNIGVVDVDLDGDVAQQLRVPRIPCIGALVNGRSILFDSDYSLRTIRDFTRKLFPEDLVGKVDSTYRDNFLSEQHDNRVKLIFFGTRGLPTLRLMIALSGNIDRVKAGYVDVSSGEPAKLLEDYDVQHNSETIMIFKEDLENPAYISTRAKFATEDISTILQTHKYLNLPRLSSMDIMDELCPASLKVLTRRYCIVITLPKNLFSSTEMSEFYTLATSLHNVVKDVQFLYAFTDTQTNIVSVWKRPEGHFKVLLLTRKGNFDVDYDWFDWCSDCSSKVRNVALKLDSNSYRLRFASTSKYEVKNEFQASLYLRIARRLYHWWDHFTYTYFVGDSTFTLLSLLSTVTCIVIITVLLKIAPQQHLDSHQEHLRQQMAMKPFSTAARTARFRSATFTLYEMKNSNYDRLVKDAPSGYRFIVLLVDDNRREQYLKRFTDLMRPFNMTPYFWFGLLSIDKYLVWYKRLLLKTIGSNKEVLDNLNPSHCAGTVLAINGHRRYYNIYHPKTINIRKGGGDFIGFEDNSSSDDDGDIHHQNGHGLNGTTIEEPDGDVLLIQGRVLDGLGLWIDRLFDGSLPKCKIDNWPLFPIEEPTQFEEEKEL